MKEEELKDKLQYIKDAGFELTDYETLDMLDNLIEQEKQAVAKEVYDCMWELNLYSDDDYQEAKKKFEKIVKKYNIDTQ